MVFGVFVLYSGDGEQKQPHFWQRTLERPWVAEFAD